MDTDGRSHELSLSYPYTVRVKQSLYISCRLRKNAFPRIWLEMLNFLFFRFARNVQGLFDPHGTIESLLDSLRIQYVIRSDEIRDNRERYSNVEFYIISLQDDAMLQNHLNSEAI